MTSEADALVDPDYLHKMDELRSNLEDMRAKIQILVRPAVPARRLSLTLLRRVDLGSDSRYAQDGESSQEELGVMGARDSDRVLLGHVTVRTSSRCGERY